MRQLTEKAIQIIERLKQAKSKKSAIKICAELRAEGFNKYTVRYHYTNLFKPRKAKQYRKSIARSSKARYWRNKTK